MTHSPLRSKASIILACAIIANAGGIREQRAEEERVQARWKKLEAISPMYSRSTLDTGECLSCKKRPQGIRITPTETMVRSNMKHTSR
jgi:hypothetical protein